MTSYIALLRGINVGGNKIIKMQDLKLLFQSLELDHVRTYIQSGNVIFESNNHEIELLGGLIELRIKEVYGFQVSVILRTLEELAQVIENNPFDLPEQEDYKRLYVSFLTSEPSTEALEKLQPYMDGPDKLRFVGKEMYAFYEVSVSQSALFKVPMDKMLGMPATSRNWNTVNKLVALGRVEKP
ncbi:DUF1697 domain-containing protein [Paenibacillus wynnii]|uniref:Cytoplasmic protein n=1 Tax=Paenibacillus wynnii TaxID=268407 RepID=A0A098MBS6_9BACL|nr:DUF1697 domain-containing protein [Paenibacillus wynnii]KGE19508.1 hypothetical protein PWYN_09275 [Paenibacillus wynnii]